MLELCVTIHDSNQTATLVNLIFFPLIIRLLTQMAGRVLVAAVCYPSSGSFFLLRTTVYPNQIDETKTKGNL